MGHIFLSDCWIAVKPFQEFSKVFFLGVGMESLLDEEVWMRQTRITAQKGHNF
jgi:hypothetical protein